MSSRTYRRKSRSKKYDKVRWEVERERYQIEHPVPPTIFKEAESAFTGVEKAFKRMRKFGIYFSVHESLLQSEWIKIVGSDLAKRTMPGNLDNGQLFVYVKGAVWLAELRRNSIPNMIKRINQHLGKNTVKKITLRPAPSGYKQ